MNISGHETFYIGQGTFYCECGYGIVLADDMTVRIAHLEHVVEVLSLSLAKNIQVAEEANRWASMNRPIGGS